MFKQMNIKSGKIYSLKKIIAIISEGGKNVNPILFIAKKSKNLSKQENMKILLLLFCSQQLFAQINKVPAYPPITHDPLFQYLV